MLDFLANWWYVVAMKNTLKYILGTLIISLITTQTALAADPWPTSTSGTQIGSGLLTLNTTGNGFEASGLEYLDGYGYIAIGDDGDIGVLSISDAILHYWNTYQSSVNDFEDVTITDTSATDNKVYIANEYSNKIEEFNISTGVKTGKSWTLFDLPSNLSTGAGFEALAYVPAADAPASWGTAQSGGFFLAASQSENIVRVYTFNRSTSATVSSVATLTLDQSYYDIGALNYNTSTDLLYVVFDSNDKLKEYSLAGVEINSYELPHFGETVDGVNSYSNEAFVIVPNCSTGLAEVALGVDNISSRITVYSNYPITCTETTPVEIDADSDGYNSVVDCNDTDSSVYTSITYYRDADSDTLGTTATTTSVCSTIVPSGYVTNSSDSNDADYDNDGVSTGTDCNDADSAISSNQTYYQDADGDGLGSATVTTSVCSYTAPSGYVTNNTDSNDSDFDNDGVNTSADCNDADSTISANQTYYRDADNDGMGDPNTTSVVCSYTVTAGYVTNATDTDDTQAPVTTEPTPTEPEPTPTEPEIILPSVPTDLVLQRLALRKVKMSWTGNGEYYNLKLTDTTTNATTTFTNITSTSKTVGSKYIFAKHTYSFTVQACNTQGCSEYSNNKSFKTYSVKKWRKIQRLNRNR